MKNLAKILCMLLCICISLSMLSGCVNSPDADPETETETQTERQTETEITTESDAQSETESETETETDPFADFTVTEGELYGYTEMIKGSSDTISLKENRYVIIRNSKISQSEIDQTALKLYKAVINELGLVLNIKADTNKPYDYEIIIGDTSRDESVDATEIKYLDYGWKVVGSKIVIYGGSTDAISTAVEKFVLTYADAQGSDLKVPVDAEFIASYNYPYSDIAVVGNSIEGAQIVARASFSAYAEQIAAHVGRLTGYKLPIKVLADGEQAPREDAIFVGVETKDALEAQYKVTDGVLNFISNTLDGDLNPLDVAIDAFFEERFPTVTEVTRANIDASATATYGVEIKNMQYASSDDIDRLNAEFDRRVEEILNAEDITPDPDGTTYYVSPNGDDNNDGKSPATAWATVRKVSNTIALKSGDTVLFERGGVWNIALNGKNPLIVREGTTFGAYGEGAKPMITCHVTANETSDWTEVADGIWVYSGAYNSPTHSLSVYPNNSELAGSYLISANVADQSSDDVGNIVLTKGDKLGWAAKITTHRDDTIYRGYSVNIGTVPVGDFGTVTHASRAFTGYEDLTDEYTFWHDEKNSRVYMHCSFGNPADYYDDIKMTLFASTVNMQNNTVMDNFNISFTGGGGIDTGSIVNATVQNCEIGFIGGSIQSYSFGGRTHPTRFGNGIGNWGSCDGMYILNNYIHDVYDAGVSPQHSNANIFSSMIMKDYHVIGNAMERNIYDVEIFMHGVTEPMLDAGTHGYLNIKINDNLMRNAGRGFGNTRFDKSCKSIRVIDPVTLGGCEMKGNSVWGVSGITLGAHFFNTDEGCVLDNNTIICEYGSGFSELWDYSKGYNNYDEYRAVGIKYSYTSENIQALIENKTFGENNLFMFTPGE